MAIENGRGPQPPVTFVAVEALFQAGLLRLQGGRKSKGHLI